MMFGHLSSGLHAHPTLFKYALLVSSKARKDISARIRGYWTTFSFIRYSSSESRNRLYQLK